MPFDDYPDAYFAIRKPDQITHGGYADIKCEFDSNGIVFGKVGENGQPQQLELNISRTAKIYNKDGDEVCTVEVTNDKYNLSTGSELKFTRSMGDNSPFTFAVNIPANTYIDLDAGAYTLAVEYQATWQNVIDFSTWQQTDDVTLPTGTIAIALGKFADAEFGSFGKGLSWEFSYYGGRLTIFGNGAMPDYDAENLSHRPWDHLKDKVESIYITQDITAIGKNAFSGFTSAKTLTFNDYTVVKTIGDRAFAGCGFTSLELPESVTTIGESAFQGCNKISGSITIPSKVTSVGKAAFSNCGFERVYCYAELTSISDNMFANCYNLESFSIPYSVKTIGESAFEGCSKFTGTYLPENITSIGRCAFMNSGLTYITIPSGVTKIAYSTFYGCRDLTSVIIPGTVTTIEDDAFFGCSDLETLTIPNSVTTISGGAFFNCDKLNTLYCQADPDKLTWGASSSDFISNKGTKCYVASRFITKYESKFGSINVDFEAKSYASGTCGENVNWTLDGDGTLFITGTGAMYNYKNSWGERAPWYEDYTDYITSVVISDGVTTVGDWAFYTCRKLSSVSLPDSLKSIGVRAFGETASLTSIELPSNLETIGDLAFCVSMIRSITIPDSVTTIGDNAFLSAYKMTSVNLGNGVETLGYGVFSSTAIESIVIPSSVKTIGDEAFDGCSSLTTVTISDGLESIGEECFLYCTKLKSINIPEGVTTIKDDAFYGCYALESITIPGSVQNMGVGVFRDCTSLTSATISNGVTSIPEGTFYNCGDLKNVTLPDTLTSIGKDAFRVENYQGTGKIESIVIPDSVTDINAGAFYGQGLRSITIPGSVSVIKEDAFRFCDSLESVIILEGVTEIEGYAFAYCNNIKTVSVPSTVTSIGSSQVFGPGANLTDIYSYSEATPWKSFSYGVGYNTDTKLHVPADKVESYRQLLNPGSTLISGTNLVGDAEGSGQINTGAGVHLYGYTLSLAGDIGINYWMELNPEYVNADNYMLFTVNGRTQKVKVSEATAASNSKYKVFSCGVAAKEMTDTITAQFYLADGTAVGSAYNYTVRDYANYILTHDGYSQNTKNIVKKMLNYGACSQKYFKYHTDSLANSVLSEDDRYTSIASPNDVDYKTDGSGCITPERVSLSLDSTITLKLYFKNEDAEGKVFIRNGKTLTTAKSHGYTVVFIDDITVLWLNSGVGFDVYENDTKLGNVEYSPAKYCKIVLSMDNDGNINDDLKRLVSALCEFNEALHNRV